MFNAGQNDPGMARTPAGAAAACPDTLILGIAAVYLARVNLSPAEER